LLAGADVTLTPASVEAVARRVVELLNAPAAGPLVGADAVARHLGVERSWVYEHATELRARRLGSGEKGRLRFDLRDVDEAIACSSGRGSGQAEIGSTKPIQRRRAPSRLGTKVALLPVKGSGEAA
jgi:hypothetical protein